MKKLLLVLTALAFSFGTMAATAPATTGQAWAELHASVKAASEASAAPTKAAEKKKVKKAKKAKKPAAKK